MANEFTGRRTVKGQFTINSNSATTAHSTGIQIPAGALISNIWWEAPGAVTVAGASATVKPMVGSAQIAATVNIKNLPAQTVAASTAVALTRIPATGELLIHEQASSDAAATGTWNVYVDYIFVK